MVVEGFGVGDRLAGIVVGDDHPLHAVAASGFDNLGVEVFAGDPFVLDRHVFAAQGVDPVVERFEIVLALGTLVPPAARTGCQQEEIRRVVERTHAGVIEHGRQGVVVESHEHPGHGPIIRILRHPCARWPRDSLGAAMAELDQNLHASEGAPDRNLALELVRVTEAAALAAARWVGHGDKIAADQAAVDAMRFVLDSVPMDGTVVIGEGEKDEAPMLYNGERIGDGSKPEVDIAVDPLEGTTLTAKGFPSALSVIALSERGTMFDPGPCVYMEKMAGTDEIADLLDLDRPIAETLSLIAARKSKIVSDVLVIMLDRDRHQPMAEEVRKAGARIRFITDGDVSGALMAVSERSPVDLLWGIGGTPEGVISAAAIHCMGGRLVGRLWPRNDEERSEALNLNYDLDAILTEHELVKGDDVFFAATGVTDGDMLQGVRYPRKKATTESLIMRSRSGTVRRVLATHNRAKLREITGERYG